MEDLLVTASPLLFVLVGGGIGRLIEVRHERQLRVREANLQGFVVTDLPYVPGSSQATNAVLVMGEAVVAADYGKQIVARVRNVYGGEVRSFRKVLDRSRREAILRMIAQAKSCGATAIVNARFETTMIRRSTAEVLCYGTAVTH